MRARGSMGKTDAYIRMMLRLCLCVCMGVKSVMAGVGGGGGGGGDRSSCGLNWSGHRSVPLCNMEVYYILP